MPVCSLMCGVEYGYVEDEAILSRPSGGLFVLDEIGAFVLRCALERDSVDDIIEAVVGRYEVGEREARADIVDYLGKLRTSGLVDFSDADTFLVAS